VADNISPPTATVTLDVRTTPAYTNREIVKLIDGAVSGRVRVVTDLWAPCETPLDHPLVACAKAALPGAAVFASDAASDWAFFSKEGVPAIKVGPGDPRWSHAANERITGEELAAGVAGFQRLAELWLQRGA
jgi:acetylornithine deacetylase/succinyl-diaminopimelate desuccinylase-like protein